MLTSTLLFQFLAGIPALPGLPANLELDIAERLPTGLTATDIGLGDLNEDGILDAVSLTRHGPGVILLSNAAGGHDVVDEPDLSSDVFPDADEGRDLVLGDFDGDGHLDVSVLQFTNDRVLLLRGDGSGNLSPATILLERDAICRPEAADFNEDGASDLFFKDVIFDAIVVFPTDGNGGLSAPVVLPVAPLIRDCAVGDFVCDGNLDLLASTSDDELVVFPGGGDGTFGPPVTTTISSAPSHLVVADYDGDLFDDCIGFGPSLDGVIYSGDGVGGFTSTGIVSRDTNPLMDADVGDQNGDGHPDLFLLANDVSLLLNDGSGGFELPETYAFQGFLDRVFGDDLDGDGMGDVVVASLNTNLANVVEDHASFAYSAGEGEIESSRAIGGGIDRQMVTGDFDEDGDAELVTVDRISGEFLIFDGDGSGGFLMERSVGVLQPNLGPRNVLAGDVDGDGHQDLAVYYTETSRVSTFLGDGSGGFAPRVDSFVGALVRTHALLADVNEDSSADLIATHNTDELKVHLSDGSGRFVPGETALISDAENELMVVADLNRDGHIDLLARCPFRTTVVFLGDGTGGFTEGDRFDSRYTGAVLDRDSDQVLDYVFTDTIEVKGASQRILFSRRGRGDGTFEDPVVLGPSGFSGPMTTARIDEDELADLVTVGDSTGNLIFFLRQDESGTFEEINRVKMSSFPDFEVSDLDGDGRDDFLALHTRANVRILLNRTEFFDCRRGLINAGIGPVTDVLFVNGSAGEGRRRIVRTDQASPFELRIDATPAGGAEYVAYVWRTGPSSQDLSPLFSTTGTLCLPIAFHGATGRRAPKAIWKTIPGLESILGIGNQPASSAPSVLLSLSQLPVGGASLFVQALMQDPGSLSGIGDVTNGVEVRIR